MKVTALINNSNIIEQNILDNRLIWHWWKAVRPTPELKNPLHVRPALPGLRTRPSSGGETIHPGQRPSSL